jgi:hypothetical protein
MRWKMVSWILINERKSEKQYPFNWWNAVASDPGFFFFHNQIKRKKNNSGFIKVGIGHNCMLATLLT